MIYAQVSDVYSKQLSKYIGISDNVLNYKKITLNKHKENDNSINGNNCTEYVKVPTWISYQMILITIDTVI